MSSPAPPVSTFAPDEPVIVSALDLAEASTFSNRRTTVASPVVWSDPAATARSIALTVALASSTSVSLPAPPSTVASTPRSVTVSAPPPASITSEPPNPSIVSAPAPPVSTLVPVEPPIAAPCADPSPDPSTFSKPDTAVGSPTD